MIPSLAPLWTRLSRAPGALLLLDFDGTLAPFRENRLQSRLYPEIRPVLEALERHSRTRVVIITGRPCRSLASLLDLDPAPEIWGSHGAERLLPGGEYREPPMEESQREGLYRAHWTALLVLPPTKVERKPISVAAHWRGIALERRNRIRRFLEERWPPLASRYGLKFLPFDGGLEIVIPGFHKGTAVARLLSETPPDHPIAYLGDDLTDEQAFFALGSRGLPVLVRSAWRPTRARLWLCPPGELRAFLLGWLRVTLVSPGR
jgi:trehalose-phosphatase